MKKTVKSFDERDLDPILEGLRAETLRNDTVAIHQANMRQYGSNALSELGATGLFNMQNPLTLRYLENFAGKKIIGINKTTIKSLRKTLITGVREGEDIRRLANRVNHVFAFTKGRRAATIARTEVVGASNIATFEAHKQSGVVSRRQWVATFDNRTRDLHAALNGQIVDIDKMFNISSYATWCPGSFGRPELDINCRCTTVAVVGSPGSKGLMRHHWKQFANSTQSWETQLRYGFQKGFQKQHSYVLEELNKLE